MDFRKKIRLGDLLVEAGSITQEQLMSALEKQKKTGMKLGVTLVDEGVITEDDIAEALGRQLGIEIVDLQNINVDKAVTQLVPVKIHDDTVCLQREKQKRAARGDGKSAGYVCAGRYFDYHQLSGRAGGCNDTKHHARH